jgi:preprotein translocase subunit SecY
MWVQYLSAMQHSTGGAPIFMGGMVIQITAILVMTTGTMLLMWLGDQITQFGIGNGISLIIMAGIVDRLPYSIYDLVRPGQHIEAGTVLFLIIAFVVVVGGVVLMTQGQRRIPVQQAKHTRGRRVYGGQRQYLPFRVNHSGVMPVIFASTLLLFPIMVANGLQNAAYVGDFFREVHTMLNRGTWLYVVLYVGLIYFFAYFWTSIVFKPKDLAENLQDYGSFIPGIRPGPRTAGYLEGIMTRITLAGATFLAIVAVIPQILQGVMGISGWMAGFYGGTSLLIVVGVALDLVEKIESHLMMRHYEGFMRKGKIRGRR